MAKRRRAEKDPNPFAPPAEDEVGSSPADRVAVWQEDGLVVVRRPDGELPHRCVVCNQPSTRRSKRVLGWHHPAWYLTALVGLIPYGIAMLAFRRQAELRVPLCDAHRRKRAVAAAIGVGGSLLAIVVTFRLRPTDGGAFLFGGLGMLLFLALGALLAHDLGVSRIDDREIRLRAGRDFVASLPRKKR